MGRSVWIEGCEGRFKIHDNGMIETFVTKTPRFRKPFLHSSGYLIVSLRMKRGDESKTFQVHQLVAKHFVPGYKLGLVVNHKNLDRTDNRAENLEWVTQKENLAHAARNGRRGGLWRPVKGVHIETGEVVYFNQKTDAAKAIGGYAKNIWNCCNNMPHYKTYKKYKWSYV